MATLSLGTEHRADHAIVTDDAEPDTRYIVMHDADTESPTHWGNFDVYVYRASYRSNTDESCADESLIARAFFTRYELEHDEHDALRFARRWATIYGGMTTEQANERITTHSARGYSQSDWWDILVISDDSDAEQDARTWEQWARGDVYFVYPESRAECEHPEYCHSHNDDDHWSREPLDYKGIGGIYADDAESAVMQYLSIS